MRHVRNPPGGKEEENKAWWKQRKVIGGLAGAVITPLIVAWLIFLLGPPSSSGPAVTPRPTPKCSTDKAIGYRKPTQLKALDKTSLAICSVDVNNGQPIGRSISLSGTVLGTLPPNEHLAVVSYPDPSTCDTQGNPGNGYYYELAQIDPSDNQGNWQVVTGKVLPRIGDHRGLHSNS